MDELIVRIENNFSMYEGFLFDVGINYKLYVKKMIECDWNYVVYCIEKNFESLWLFLLKN